MNNSNTCGLIKKTVFDTPLSGAKWVANEIADLIRLKAERNENCVLGLATGGTPIAVYNELVSMHKNEGLSFANVVTFNLDEYFPMQLDDVQSYNYFMFTHLFNHIDIPRENINIPNGEIDENQVADYCNSYDEKIRLSGGIDLQLLGIGRTGHIGFNEPGSDIASKTRYVLLNDVTRTDAIAQFGDEDLVPLHAITMGVNTILKSKRIVLMAWGKNKADIVNKACSLNITDKIPATFLQLHKYTQFVIDNFANS